MVLSNNSHFSLDILSLNSEVDVYLILFNRCIMSFTFPFSSPFPFIKKTLLSYILGIKKYIYLKCAVHWILTNVCSLSASSQDIEYFYYLQNFPHRYSLKNVYVLLWNDCQIFCPFEKWIAVFLLSCKCSLYLFWTQVFCQVMYCEYFFLVVWDLTFLFLYTVSWKIKAFKFVKIQFIFFSYC